MLALSFLWSGTFAHSARARSTPFDAKFCDAILTGSLDEVGPSAQARRPFIGKTRFLLAFAQDDGAFL
jgi:hypothetical protein